MQYKGFAYRAHNPYWSVSPVSGEGAQLHGGRFNPKGIPALYLSLTTPTALAEYNQGFPHRPQPVTLCAYEIECQDMLDLCSENQRETAGVTLSEMACAWELMIRQKQIPPTWAMATRLINAGIAGIIVPSYARNSPNKGQNIILWDWSDTLPHKVRVIDDNQVLPKDQTSWQ